MKKILKKAIILPLMIGVALVLVILIVKIRPEITHQDLQFPTKTVEVISVKKLAFRSRSVGYGHVEPAVLLNVRTEISGKISYIHPALKKGASLAKGTVVLRIEPTTFEFSLDQSKAGLTSSQSSLAQLEVEQESSRRSLDLARKTLQIGQKELERFKILWEKRVITRSTMDGEEQKVLQLSQQVEDLEGKLASFTSRKSATIAQIRKSRTQLAQSQDTLGRTEISLPFDARIGVVSVEKGEYVTASKLLFEASGTKAVEISAQMPVKRFSALISGLSQGAVNLQKPDDLQAAFDQIQLGVKVRLVGGKGGGETWQADLLRIGEAIDPTRDTVSLVVVVNNPYEDVILGKRPPLLKGMYVAVEFYTPPRLAVVIPRKALHEGRVYVAKEDNTLEIRPVTILYKQGPLVVIERGLEGGEKLIITDVIPVMDGLPLSPILARDEELKLAQEALGEDAVNEEPKSEKIAPTSSAEGAVP